MTKHIKPVLFLVMAMAIIVMIVCAVRFVRLNNQLHADERTLSESRHTWERIAAEKEELQTELKALKDELKEAEFSLNEATERAEELKEEITLLQQEIEQLKAHESD